MCGIAGVIAKRPLPSDRIEAAYQALHVRGPDGHGVYQSKLGDWSVTLIHARLAIIDLDSRGKQPFLRDDLALCYNGEIYNYLESRQALQGLGDTFQTETDTEVLAAQLRRFGPHQGLDGMEGMWAFAAHDERAGEVWLSRDRFGEKPLLLWQIDDALYFASSIKALAAMAGYWPEPNLARLGRYLVHGYKAVHTTNDTAFEGVQSLLPGTVMTVTNAQLAHAKPYWSLQHSPVSMNREDAIAGVRERLERSVELRLRSDVPLAFCLSGGIDSTALVALAKVKFGHDVQCFSIVDSDPRYDESENIDATQKALGCPVTRIHTTMDGFTDGLSALVGDHDAPVATISYYVHAQLSKAIADAGCKVALSGTAADELFTGYYDHSLMWLAGMHDDLGDGPAFERLVEEWRQGYGRFVRNPFLQNPRTFIEDPGMRDHIAPLTDAFQALMQSPVAERPEEQCYAKSLLHSRMMNELFHESVPLILDQDDRNSMRVSLENRSPFLDRDLVEFAYRIPTEHLMRGGVMKAVLRDAVADVLPPQVLNDKRKRGFNASILSVLDPTDAETRDWLLADGPIFDMVDRSNFEAFLETDLTDNERSKFVFSFASVRSFLDIQATH